MLIEKINSPADLKKLSVKELNALAEELRGELIDVISKNGGHLSSNLGVVELTVSLHFLFDSPADRILWDVGHQSYVHKLLTGRRERFGTLRQFGGLSGFPNPAESAHDAFVAGHSGNSVSAALGFAEEEARRGSGRYTVAVVGDGSFTNGMIYEALNNCGNKNLRLIIVLNDNEMSISKNVGAVSSYFSRFRTGGRYLRFKRVTARALLALPLVGKPLFRLLRGIKNLFKRLLVSENLFELLGLEYIGPVDGNDLSRLNAVLREAKSMEKPCVVHVCTTKGKGYPGAERRPDTYHSVGAFDKSCGVDPDGCCTGFSALFGELMCARAQADPALVAITAAMCDGTGLCGCRKAFPDRFYDVGIAEEHALTFAAGLAAAGAHPVLAVYSSFCQRCFDQILHDAALPALPVVLAVDRAGLVCADGPTHHGVFDVSFLRGVPGMTVYSPETASELRESFEKAFAAGAPAAVRYPKSGDCPDGAETYTVCAGGTVKYRDFGSPKTVAVTYGRMAADVCAAAAAAGDTRVIKLIKIHPIDYKTLAPLLDGAQALLLCEEGIRAGGVAEGIAAALAGGRPTRIRAIEGFVPHGDEHSLKKLLGFLPEQLADDLRSLKQ